MANIVTYQISVNDTADYQKVYDLREQVLRQPIGLSLRNEDLSGDRLDKIVVAKQGNDIIGCVMIHPEAGQKVFKLRQMAVSPEWQRAGVGKALISHAEKLSWQEGAEAIVLHARITAQAFYEKSGYTAVGEVFTEVGIPHIVMEKRRQ